MRIEYRESPERRRFEHLIPGDTFAYDEDIYLKTEKLKRPDECVISNAVSLRRNLPACFDDGVEVILTPCHIVLD